jgi:integrase
VMDSMIMRLKLPYLVEDADRHGNIRLYVRKKGRRKVRIRETPGTNGFLEAYRVALTEVDQVPVQSCKPRQGSAGTIGWLSRRYMASAEFRRLERQSQRTRAAILESCFAEPLKPGSDLTMGDVPIDKFEAKHVKVLRDRKAEKPGAARNRLKALRCMLAWAVEAEHAIRNVATEVRSISYASIGFYTWTVEEVRQFERRHPVGSKARLAMALLLLTGQRRSNVVRFGPQNVHEGVLRFMQRKTRKKAPKIMELPILPELNAILAATPTGDATFLVTSQAKPKEFTSNGFGNRFREWCDQAGLRHCSAHGLRKAGACIAAERGATEAQLMAIFGWTEAKQAALYTKMANQKHLAAASMHLLVPREPTRILQSWGEHNQDESVPPPAGAVSHRKLKPSESTALVGDGGPGRTRTCNQTVMSGRL